MEKKIIELTKYNDGFQCIICCERKATIKFKVNRPKHDDSVTSFHICDECLAKMQKDIETCE
jgi:hypothetical protein